MLRMNFAAIHITGTVCTHKILSQLIPDRLQTFTLALHHMATERKNYLQPLRDEIEDILRRDGWTKASLSKMPQKLDSFMTESHRCQSLGAGEACSILRSGESWN
jgi:hypothetical protein